jgi:hypothetical protein
MTLELSDKKAAGLTADITGNDHYPFSERIRHLKAIVAKLTPELAWEPLPLPEVHTPPRATAAKDGAPVISANIELGDAT